MMTTTDHWTRIPGHFTFQAFYGAWVDRARDLGWGPLLIAEVGVLGGQSACYLLERLKAAKLNANVYLVDSWPNGFEVVRKALDDAGVLDRVAGWHRAISWEAAASYADSSFDLVYLDADHAYESVSKDIAAWYPKVARVTGVLAGHDYSPSFPGVVRAVTEAFDRIEVVRGERFTGPRRDELEGDYFPTWVAPARPRA